MKQAEPKNPVWDSTRSTLVTAVIDRCNMRFLGVGLLSMVIDLLVFQVLFASGANLELSQILSFFAGAILSFALNADGGASELKQSSIRWAALYARFLLVALLALLLRSAVLMLLVGNWHWQPQTAILVAIPMAAAVFHVGAVFYISSIRYE
jgi:putative flippase GtrA